MVEKDHLVMVLFPRNLHLNSLVCGLDGTSTIYRIHISSSTWQSFLSWSPSNLSVMKTERTTSLHFHLAKSSLGRMRGIYGPMICMPAPSGRIPVELLSSGLIWYRRMLEGFECHSIILRNSWFLVRSTWIQVIFPVHFLQPKLCLKVDAVWETPRIKPFDKLCISNFALSQI